MRVNNINGTFDNICKCGSWLSHWKRFSGQPMPTYCSERTCTKPPEMGAHVQKDTLADRNWYIVPLCGAHNAQRGASIDIMESTTLVSANVSETCGMGW